jgi:hypothetical protein
VTVTARALPGRFLACFLYTIRVCVPPRRWALLAIPTIGAVLFGLLARALDDPTPEGAFNSITIGLFGLVLPFASLVVGDAVLGAERRSGAFALTWLSPVPFATIAVARWLAGWVVTAVALAPAMAAGAVVAGVPGAIGPLLIATLASSSAYVALFLVIGVMAQRAVLWSLGIVLLGERLLGEALSGIAQLSPQWLARTAYGGLGPDADELLRNGVPSGWGAVVRLVVLTAVFLGLAEWRLRRLRMSGPTD